MPLSQKVALLRRLEQAVLSFQWLLFIFNLHLSLLPFFLSHFSCLPHYRWFYLNQCYLAFFCHLRHDAMLFASSYLLLWFLSLINQSPASAASNGRILYPLFLPRGYQNVQCLIFHLYVCICSVFVLFCFLIWFLDKGFLPKYWNVVRFSFMRGHPILCH